MRNSAPETHLSTASPGLDTSSKDSEEGKAKSLGVGKVVLVDEGPSAAARARVRSAKCLASSREGIFRSRDVDERVQVSVLKVERNKVEESDEAAGHDGLVAEETKGEDGLGRPPSLVVDESDEDERTDDEHGDDLSAVPLEGGLVDLSSRMRKTGQLRSSVEQGDSAKAYKSEGEEEARPSTGEEEESESVEVDEVVKGTAGDGAAVPLGDLSIRLVRVVGGDDTHLASLELSVVD